MDKFTASFPKFNVNGFLAMQRANVETVLQAQRVLVDAAQAMFRLQAGWLNETARQAQDLAKANVAKGPQGLIVDARAATERAFAVAREGLDVGVKTQGEVADLVTKRVAANVDQVKAFASAA